TKIFSVPAATAATVAPTALVSDGTNSSLVVGTQSLYYLKASFMRPDEVYSLDLVDATHTSTVRTHLNDGLFDGLKLGRVEEYTFTGAAGDTIQGWLIYPPDFDPKKKYPLLELMHGGPATM